MLKVLDARFFKRRFTRRTFDDYPEELAAVREIVRVVQLKGDKAMRFYTAEFDGAVLETLRVSEEEFERAERLVDQEVRELLYRASENIASFHRRGLRQSWQERSEDGVVLGERVTALASVALFVCTAMIYACLKFLQEWASPYTLVNYTLLGLASGCTLATALAGLMAPELVGFFGAAALLFTALGLVSRWLSLLRNARLVPRSTLQSAIGIRHPKITQRAQGFMGGSFNTREFFHGKTPGALRSVKWAFLLGAFVLPLALVALGIVSASAGLLVLAFVVQYLGLLAERWFFFAQANHPQNLYYQTVS